MIRSLAFLFVSALMAFGCQTKEAAPPPDGPLSFEPDALIIDVRTGAEYASGHLANAVNINVFAPDFHEKVEHYDRDRPVYLYCGSGARSGRAAVLMEEMGFRKTVNLGGYRDLRAAGVQVVE